MIETLRPAKPKATAMLRSMAESHFQDRSNSSLSITSLSSAMNLCISLPLDLDLYLPFDYRTDLPHLIIAWSYFFQAKLAEAREPAEEAFRIAPWISVVVGFLAGVLAQAGEKDRAEKLIETLQASKPGGMMMYHLVCSETDAAIDWYERAIEQRQPMAAMSACTGFFKPLRASPRWPKLARMMNLSETS